ncbi:P-loop containing nucleoside triphosphate hydrolases superfamily protein [Salvia divinorum]|uniref:P-loop containing nucleoside triphosphate hydrolases superfamily protein n=1 Tax=Salvia divinorum TaxID=28513 RepID=A0ABD1GJ50_SALDI
MKRIQSHLQKLWAELIEQDEMEIDDPRKPEEQEEDLMSLSMKLAEAREKLLYSAETVSIFGSFERAAIEVDALTKKLANWSAVSTPTSARQ